MRLCVLREREQRFLWRHRSLAVWWYLYAHSARKWRRALCVAIHRRTPLPYSLGTKTSNFLLQFCLLLSIYFLLNSLDFLLGFIILSPFSPIISFIIINFRNNMELSPSFVRVPLLFLQNIWTLDRKSKDRQQKSWPVEKNGNSLRLSRRVNRLTSLSPNSVQHSFPSTSSFIFRRRTHTHTHTGVSFSCDFTMMSHFLFLARYRVCDGRLSCREKKKRK